MFPAGGVSLRYGVGFDRPCPWSAAWGLHRKCVMVREHTHSQVEQDGWAAKEGHGLSMRVPRRALLWGGHSLRAQGGAAVDDNMRGQLLHPS